MTHSPYRDWILAEPDEPFSPERAAELQAHLADCAACRELRQRVARLDRALASAAMLSPAPGFGARFELRRAARLSRARWAAGGAVLLLGALVLATVVALSAIQFASQVGTAAAIAALALTLAESFFVVQTLGGALALGVQSLAGALLAQPAWLAAAAAALALALLWVHLVHRLTLETVR